MITIIRGFPLGDRTQVGFYGTVQDVLQQQKSSEEGFPLSLRWQEPTHRKTSTCLHDTPGCHDNRKNICFCPRCNAQNALTKHGSVQRTPEIK